MTLTLSDFAAIAAIASVVMGGGIAVFRLLIRVHVQDAIRQFEIEVRELFDKFDDRLRAIETGRKV